MISIESLSSGSMGNAYRVTDGVTPILLEAGISWKEIQRRTAFETIKACFITHSHQDHSKAVKDILFLGIEVFMSEGCKKALNLPDRHNLATVKDGFVFRFGTWTIVPFDVVHDVEEPLGFVFYSTKTKEKLVFITDSMYSPYKFSYVDYWMLEANYSLEILNENVANGTLTKAMKQRIMNSHMSLETCKEILRVNNLKNTKEIYLLHLSDRNSDENKFKEEIQRLTGKVVKIP